jgi:hypothetical protein
MSKPPKIKKNEYIWVLMDDNNKETYELGKIVSINNNGVRLKFLDFNATQTVPIDSISSNSVPLLKNMLNMTNVSNTKKILENLANIKRILKETPKAVPLQPPPPPRPPLQPPPPPRPPTAPSRLSAIPKMQNEHRTTGVGNIAAMVAQKARERLESKKLPNSN